MEDTIWKKWKKYHGIKLSVKKAVIFPVWQFHNIFILPRGLRIPIRINFPHMKLISGIVRIQMPNNDLKKFSDVLFNWDATKDIECGHAGMMGRDFYEEMVRINTGSFDDVAFFYAYILTAWGH